jgi:Glycosyl transferase family 2
MRWAIISGMYNVADLAAEFCSYHFSLGVDKIFVADYGSDDRTLDLLAPFVRKGYVQIVPLPTHHFVNYDPSNAILGMIRKEDMADWVSFLDPDEYLTGPDKLKTSLAQAWAHGAEAITVSRFNLTGIGPIPEGVHHLTHLTQKIVAADARESSAAAPLSSPWIFTRLPPKVMVRVRSRLTIATGDHEVHGADGSRMRDPSMEILHLPIRGYASFQRKIEDTANYFAANPEFGPRTGWHWRRWIDLLKAGRLRQEYENQFLDAKTVASLIAEKRIVEERRLVEWLHKECQP